MPKFHSLFPEIAKGNLPFNEASKITSLKAWDSILKNRIGKLYETFIRLSVSYNRWKILNSKELVDEEIAVHFLQFEFYSEFYYYLIHSLKDTLAQILNVFYDMNIKEHKIHFNDKFTEKINNSLLQSFLNTYLKSESTRKSAKYRNSLAHRFPFNAYDNRMIVSQKEQDQFLNIHMTNPIPNEQVFEDIKITIKELGELFIILNKEFKHSTNPSNFTYI